MIGRDIAILRDELLEQSDSGFDANLNREFRAIGASNVDIHSITALRLGGSRIINGTITSHGAPSQRREASKTSHNFNKMSRKQQQQQRPTPMAPDRRRWNRNPNPKMIKSESVKRRAKSAKFGEEDEGGKLGRIEDY